MYLALFLVAILYLYLNNDDRNVYFKFAVLGSVLVLFPLTGIIIDKYFQGFYGGEEIQWLLPVVGIIAFALADGCNRQADKRKKYAIILCGCLLIFMSGFVARGYQSEEEVITADEISEVCELLLEDEGSMQVTLVAPREIMEKARAYDGRLLTAYGRDIWEWELDYAFYGNYEDWAYGLSEHMNEPFKENKDVLPGELALSGATHVVFDKDNLISEDGEAFPKNLQADAVKYGFVATTDNYVIYARAE